MEVYHNILNFVALTKCGHHPQFGQLFDDYYLIWFVNKYIIAFYAYF